MQAPPPAPPPARVAFVHDFDVWTMDASGGDRRLVADDAYDVAWSPDGSRLALTVEDGIVTVATDGSDRRVVVRARAAGDPVWSPDGTRLAFVSYRRFNPTLETIGVDGTDRRRVVRARDTFFETPEWSPDGRTLLYTRSPDPGVPQVRAVGADGMGDHVLMRRAAGARFSPDGTRLVLGTIAGARGQVCGEDDCHRNADVAVANADGTDRRILLRTRTDESDPAWSGDGTRIALSSVRNLPPGVESPTAEVYSTAADGSCLTWLTNGNRESAEPRFGPGDATPASCSTERAPLLERPVRGRPGAELWLGEEHKGALLTARKGSRYTYADCSRFQPADCPAPFTIGQSPACGPVSARGARMFGSFRTVRRLGDTFVRRFRGTPIAYLVVGDRFVSVYDSFTASPGRVDARFAVAGLRRFDGQPIGPPRLPKRLIALLPARIRGIVTPC